MSTWYEIKTTEIRTWLIEVKDDEESADALEAIESELTLIDPQEFSVIGMPDEKEREEIRRHISPEYVLELPK